MTEPTPPRHRWFIYSIRILSALASSALIGYVWGIGVGGFSWKVFAIAAIFSVGSDTV